MQTKCWYLCHLPGKREINLEAVFCVFQQFSGSPRFRAYKNEHNLQPGALKVTESEFLDEKCVSFVSLCGAMGEDLVEILSHMASRDLSQGSGHIKFELSSFGRKITHCPTRVCRSQKRDLSHRNPLY